MHEALKEIDIYDPEGPEHLDFVEIWVTAFEKKIQPRREDEARLRKALGQLSGYYDQLCDIMNLGFEAELLGYPSVANFVEKIRSTGEKGDPKKWILDALTDLKTWRKELSRIELAIASDICLTCMSVNKTAWTRNLTWYRTYKIFESAVEKWAEIRRERLDNRSMEHIHIDHEGRYVIAEVWFEADEDELGNVKRDELGRPVRTF